MTGAPHQVAREVTENLRAARLYGGKIIGTVCAVTADESTPHDVFAVALLVAAVALAVLVTLALP